MANSLDDGINIDKTVATKLLNDSLNRCRANPVTTCPIKDTVDHVMSGSYCLTFRYIMLNALVAKAINEDVDMLSLQDGDDSPGRFNARSLAKDVLFPFQKTMLGNIIDGANNDPLVNKPARFTRLRKTNNVKRGAPKKALDMLCDNLPTIETSGDALQCVDYIMTILLNRWDERELNRGDAEAIVVDMDVFAVRNFMSDLLDQGFGGAALVLVTTALHNLRFSGERYVVRAHPVNQPGTSKRQFSDLDVLRDGKPFMGTELKDKPFSSDDVEHAAEVALSAGAESLLFVAGRQSTFASQPPTYFKRVRNDYSELGMYVGVTSIDNLIDVTLSEHVDADAGAMMTLISETAELIGAIEAQMWAYKRISEAHL